MKFEWDENKARINILKHKISFKEAKSIFLDKHFFKFDDIEHSLDEDRFYGIGRSIRNNIILICFCEKKMML